MTNAALSISNESPNSTTVSRTESDQSPQGPVPALCPEGHSPTRPSYTASSPRNAVFDIVTDRIVLALEQGVVPWRREWNSLAFSPPKSLNTGKPYSGINFFLLSLCGSRFTSPFWLTFKQAVDRGGKVRKGEKGMPIFFWKTYETKEDINGKIETRFVAQYYTVFNVEQCEGLEYPKPEEMTGPPVDPIDACEAVLTGFNGPELRHGGTQASYSPIADAVQMPPKELFQTSEGYYSTLFHELTHSTGHESRLARFPNEQAPSAFGSADYSREELIAEMGAAFLCAHTGIDNATIDNSAAYINGWLRILKADKKAVVVAASAAQKATNLILGTSPSNGLL